MHGPQPRGAGWLVAAVLAVSVTGCQSGGTDVPSSGGSTPGALTATLATPPTAAVEEFESLAFTTPSGNIYCSGNDGPGGAYLQCQVSVDRWQVPPLPADDCDGDLVSGRVALGPTGRPALVECATDAVGGGETPLREYGRPMRAGPLYCVARESGLRCENIETGHGFELSQADYELF